MFQTDPTGHGKLYPDPLAMADKGDATGGGEFGGKPDHTGGGEFGGKDTTANK